MKYQSNTWINLKKMFSESNSDVVIYNAGNEIVQSTLDNLQEIDSNSVLATLIYNCAGIKVNNWIRVLGAGDGVKSRNVVSWNTNFENGRMKIEGALLIADDVIGGVFALNIGAFEGEKDIIWYFAPDSLQWESLKMKFLDFITWTVKGNVDEFYHGLRWKKWKEDVKKVGFNQAILIYPFLWAKECDIENSDKKVVPISELFEINMEYNRKLYY